MKIKLSKSQWQKIGQETGWKEDDVLLYDVVDGAIIIKNLTQTNIGVV